MKKEFIQSNILIRGIFTPSKFDKLFFIKSELIKEDEFLDECVFTTDVSKIITESLIITIRFNHVLVANRKDFRSDFIKDLIFRIIKDDSSECNASGINFKWFVFNDEELEQHTKKVFFPTKSNVINKHFDSDNSAYGYYASKDFKGSRMRMDIKPSVVKNIKDDSEEKILVFEFNFHLKFQQDNNTELIERLGNYRLYLDEAEEIVEGYE